MRPRSTRSARLLIRRLTLDGGAATVELSREELLAMEQYTESLLLSPASRAGTTTQDWTGVRIRDLAELAGIEGAAQGHCLSRSRREAASTRATLADSQVSNERSLLALKVNGEDLSLDHGFPARLSRPGAAWGPLHQMGLLDDLQGGLRWQDFVRAMALPRRTHWR